MCAVKAGLEGTLGPPVDFPSTQPREGVVGMSLSAYLALSYVDCLSFPVGFGYHRCRRAWVIRSLLSLPC